MPGHAYITGWTASADFPTTTGALSETHGTGSYDMYVAKLSADGSALEFATFIGGSGSDTGNGIALDASGNIYVIGSTSSADIGTVNAYQSSLSGTGTTDAYLVKLNAAGDTMLYASYLGDTGSETGYELAIAGDGTVAVAGKTDSSNLPVKNGHRHVSGGHRRRLRRALRSDPER